MINPIAPCFNESDSCLSEVAGPGRTSLLVGYHRYLFLSLPESQHGIDEVLALEPEEPAGANEVEFVEKPQYIFLAKQLGASIGVYGVGSIVDGIWASFGAIEDVIGAEMN